MVTLSYTHRKQSESESERERRGSGSGYIKSPKPHTPRCTSLSILKDSVTPPKEHHQLGPKCPNTLAYVGTFLSKLAYSQLHWHSCFHRHDCYHAFPAMKLWTRIKPSTLKLFRCGYSFTGLRKVTSKLIFHVHSQFDVGSGHAFLMESCYLNLE